MFILKPKQSLVMVVANTVHYFVLEPKVVHDIVVLQQVFLYNLMPESNRLLEVMSEQILRELFLQLHHVEELQELVVLHIVFHPRSIDLWQLEAFDSRMLKWTWIWDVFVCKNWLTEGLVKSSSLVCFLWVQDSVDGLLIFVKEVDRFWVSDNMLASVSHNLVCFQHWKILVFKHQECKAMLEMYKQEVRY